MTSKHYGRQERRWAARPATAKERAGLYKVALKYRAEFRAERAAADRNGHALAPSGRKPQGPSAELARFAAGIARAEFGRFYWDERRNRAPMTRRRPKPDRSNGRQAVAKEHTPNPPRH